MIPVLLLLPALVYGKIAVYVDLRAEPPLIDVSGHSSILIPEKERLIFKLDDENLKKSVANYSGKIPTNVLVRNDWGNLYKTYADWQEVVRSVKPTLLTKTDLQASQQCKSVPLLVNTTDMSVTSIWSDSTIPTNETIEYKIVYEPNTWKFNSSWGLPINKHQNYTFPERKANVTKCIVNVNLEYEATLWGDVAVNYMSKMNGSHFWKFDVNNVLGESATSVFYNESLTIVHYLK